MLLLFSLMLLALAEGRILPKRDLTNVDLKSVRRRDVEKLEQIAGEIAGLGAAMNDKKLKQTADTKFARDVEQIKQLAQNIGGSRSVNARGILSGEKREAVMGKMSEFSGLTELGLQKTGQLLNQFEGPVKRLAALNTRDLKRSLLPQSAEDWKKVEKLAALTAESTRALKDWSVSKRSKNLEQRDKVSQKSNSLSMGVWDWFPWEQDVKRGIQQRDQTQEELRSFSPAAAIMGFDWFPWEQDVKRGIQQRDQTQEELRSLSPTDARMGFDWFPWKQEFKKRETGKQSKDYGWDWKEQLMPSMEKIEKLRNQATRKVKDNHVSANERSFQQRDLTVEKVGDCYYVCSDICDPICSTSCEHIC